VSDRRDIFVRSQFAGVGWLREHMVLADFRVFYENVSILCTWLMSHFIFISQSSALAIYPKQQQ
jgi:hypothetical protein